MPKMDLKHSDLNPPPKDTSSLCVCRVPLSLIKPRRPHAEYDYVESTLGDADKLELDESKEWKDRKSGKVGKWLRGVDKNRRCRCCQVGEWRVSSPSHFERWRFRADLQEDMGHAMVTTTADTVGTLKPYNCRN
jgi:hypothetical protein